MAVAVHPPGPRDLVPGWTIVSFYRDPIGSLQRMARTYGDIARFRWGSRYEHLLVHPDLVERVLVTEQRGFIKGQALQETKRILGEGLLTSEGDFHLRQRRLVQPLFHRRRIARLRGRDGRLHRPGARPLARRRRASTRTRR